MTCQRQAHARDHPQTVSSVSKPAEALRRFSFSSGLDFATWSSVALNWARLVWSQATVGLGAKGVVAMAFTLTLGQFRWLLRRVFERFAHFAPRRRRRQACASAASGAAIPHPRADFCPSSTATCNSRSEPPTACRRTTSSKRPASAASRRCTGRFLPQRDRPGPVSGDRWYVRRRRHVQRRASTNAREHAVVDPTARGRTTAFARLSERANRLRPEFRLRFGRPLATRTTTVADFRCGPSSTQKQERRSSEPYSRMSSWPA